MPPRLHILRTWPASFEAVLAEVKFHEIRVDDRGYAVGDILELREWDPAPTAIPMHHGYTGRTVRVRVTFITPGGQCGLPVDICVMSIVKEA